MMVSGEDWEDMTGGVGKAKAMESISNMHQILLVSISIYLNEKGIIFLRWSQHPATKHNYEIKKKKTTASNCNNNTGFKVHRHTSQQFRKHSFIHANEMKWNEMKIPRQKKSQFHCRL